MESINKPNALVFVIAYLSIMALGALSGGLVVFIMIIPAIQAMGPFFHSSVVMMAMLGVFSLLLAILATWAIIGLWRQKEAGRVIAMILTTGAALVSGLSIPLLLLVGIEGISLYVPLGTAVTLFIASSGVLWSLMTRGVGLSGFVKRWEVV